MRVVRAQQKPDWDELYDIAAAQEGYFTTAQAAAAGYSPQLLGKHQGNGRVMRVRRGIYRLKHFPAGDHEDLVVIWLWSDSKGVFSHETALMLHGLSDALPAKAHLTLPASWAQRRLRAPTNVVVHFGSVTAKGARAWSGAVPVTKPARTVSDCAVDSVAPDLVAQAVRQGLQRGLFAIDDVAPAIEYAARFGIEFNDGRDKATGKTGPSTRPAPSPKTARAERDVLAQQAFVSDVWVPHSNGSFRAAFTGIEAVSLAHRGRRSLPSSVPIWTFIVAMGLTHESKDSKVKFGGLHPLDLRGNTSAQLVARLFPPPATTGETAATRRSHKRLAATNARYLKTAGTLAAELCDLLRESIECFMLGRFERAMANRADVVHRWNTFVDDSTDAGDHVRLPRLCERCGRPLLLKLRSARTHDACRKAWRSQAYRQRVKVRGAAN